MTRLNLSSPVGEVSRIGKTVVAQFKHLGVLTLKDLLFYFPGRYDDLSKITPVAEAMVGQRVVLKGRIELISGQRSRFRRKLLTHALISDGTGAIRAVWFNQPWIAKMFKAGDEVYLVGEVKDDGSGAYLSSPLYERVSVNPATHMARIVPVYPSTEKLSQKQIRYLMRQALPFARGMAETLSEALRKQYQLISLARALAQIHFPPHEQGLREAQRRLKFDELLRLQLFAASLKQELRKIPAPPIIFQEAQTKAFVEALPFRLTDDQRKSAWEIIQDLGKGQPMNRLLEGEVGSGKTVVVAIAALNCVLGVHNPPQPSLIFPPPADPPRAEREGDRSIPPLRVRGGEEGLRGQVAIMAPTEILARQHYKTFSKFLESQGITVELRTGSEKKNKHVVDADVVIGTHALIQESARFNNLVLAVVDEQHRFGVTQRAALKEKRADGQMPHLLTLTATPIPRSLALVFYGDLDISVLREMPKGRQKIETRIVADAPPLTPPRQGGETKQFPPLAEGRLGGVWSRQYAYEFVRQQVKAGHQVFWTCPIIDPSDTLGVKAATQVFEHLKTEVFTDLKIGLLHGRMKPKERERVMEEFSSSSSHPEPSEEPALSLSKGSWDSSAPKAHPPREEDAPQNDRKHAIDILVATPVIEVGIDVPNATVMVIEGAERFGLAQLHQFRGRVGRGEAKSYCLLMVEQKGDVSHFSKNEKRPLFAERLKAFLECNDGFELAERDMALRGPGELYGTAQSGFPEFKIASFADVELAKEAKEAAHALLQKDPELISYPELRKAIIAREGKAHLE